MPEPEVVKVLLRFNRMLAALDATAANGMITAYGTAFKTLNSQTDALIAEVMGKQMSFAQMKKLERYKALLGQITREMNKFAAIAQGRIVEAQTGAVRIATAGTRTVVGAALSPGIDLAVLGQAGIAWNVLPAEAFQAFVGMAGDGGPLATLLNQIGPTVRVGVTDALGEGIALGYSPRKTAKIVQRRVGMGLTRALTISRTETLRAYRESTRLQYAANPNIVKGYIRRSAQNARTCMACIALDGKRYPLTEALDEHVNGRCVLVPDTVTYKDLGLNVKEPPSDPFSSRDWFNQQTPAVQSNMMGTGKFKAWKNGDFQLEDMARIDRNRVWGDQAVEKSLKQLVG